MKPSPASPGNGAAGRSSAHPLWIYEKLGRDRFQTLLESDSTAVYTCDSTGAINYYNKRAADLWGRRPIIDGTPERFCGSCRLYWSDGMPMPHDQSPMADVLAGRVPDIYDAEMQSTDSSSVPSTVFTKIPYTCAPTDVCRRIARHSPLRRVFYCLAYSVVSCDLQTRDRPGRIRYVRYRTYHFTMLHA
jgi:PAS domain-containing protein